MNFLKVIGCIFCCGLFLGCSGDDIGGPPAEVSKTPDFRVVGEDIANIYQYNYNADLKEGELINLTLENNVALQYLELRQVKDLLTFYSFSSGKFSAVQRNAVTGVNGSLTNFYTVSTERSILWGDNSETDIFMGFFSPQGSTDYGLRVIDLITDQQTDINIAPNVKNVYKPLYSNGKLFLTYRDNLNQNKVAIFNTESSTLINTLDFGSETTSLFIDGDGDIAVILATDNANQKYRVYDFETLDLSAERPFILDRLFAPGPVQASISDEKMFYVYDYSQPAPILSAPAIFDFAREENNIIDLISIAQQVEQDLGAKIVISAMEYRAAANSFLVGYGKQDNNSLEGGVLIISNFGELRENIKLPFAPTYIVKE